MIHPQLEQSLGELHSLGPVDDSNLMTDVAVWAEPGVFSGAFVLARHRES